MNPGVQTNMKINPLGLSFALAALLASTAAFGATAEEQAKTQRLKAAADHVLAGAVSIAITPKLDGVEEPILSPVSDRSHVDSFLGGLAKFGLCRVDRRLILRQQLARGCRVRLQAFSFVPRGTDP